MPRPKCRRKIGCPPIMKGFQPFGISACEAESITLLFEEYEAVRLTDYDGLTQEQAAERMLVSRPTFTRIYDKARKSIAKAFVEGKILEIKGGDVQFGTQWFRCRKCHKLVEGADNHNRCNGCNQYGDAELEAIE